MLMANNSSVPVVGEGATILSYTDRHAYTVREFNPKTKKVIIQRCESTRVDNLGMSDSQTYDYTKHEDYFIVLKYRYNNWYEECYNKHSDENDYSKKRIIFGVRDEYYDFSF
tara:strand:- start:1539 stop:1874 length:336 start_codon:yes stop_codon:yes gene_type:complete